MDEEIASIEKNNTWKLVDLPDGKNVIGVKWIYKTKFKEDGSIHKHKARLVAKVYSQQHGVDAWNSKIDSYFRSNGFERSQSEPSLYVKKGVQDFLIVCLYVDDLIYTGTSLAMVQEFKKAMMEEYEMTDLGLMKYFLGIQVRQSKGEIFISQEKYLEEVLKKFHMNNCKPISTPLAVNEKFQLYDGADKADSKTYRSIVGSLIYLTNTRPNIVYPVSLISRFMHEPSKLHFAVAKRILRYLRTRKFGIKYVKEKENELVGYTDSDWAGSLDDRKSTSGYVFCLGSKIISWASKKQKTISLSSAEVEYIAATDAACEAVWLRRILSDVQQSQDDPTTILCDNMSAIAMTKNPVFHARSKHIEL
ncbi:hypothetical protein DH2020_000711 [Rehmannia glutinosa]|uniref:Reverse transcriptase Ty1/copia-type domain-containing protein n=1 Tax=Rehmannia glutinosa TaxID=99300 RepID=A0ABR0XXG0_REHGL